MDPIRLQKFIADNGVMSRRAAEAEIEKGNIIVNGEPAYIGQKIDADTDIVEYKGRVVAARDPKHTYVMLNKPRGCISSAKDEKGRLCVTDIVKIRGKRIYPVGRLDYNSEGLILLTDDGALTNKLTHPRHSIPKIYVVSVASEPTEKQIELLSSPLIIDGYRIMPVKLTTTRGDDGSFLLRMELYEGRNRQIRKMCDIVGLKIISLTRVAIGNIELG